MNVRQAKTIIKDWRERQARRPNRVLADFLGDKSGYPLVSQDGDLLTGDNFHWASKTNKRILVDFALYLQKNGYAK